MPVMINNCNTDKHPAVLESCSKTAEGTSNLLKGMNTCVEAQGISKRLPKDDPPIPYSVAGYQALLAVLCYQFTSV